jgi:UDP-N-acetylmuramoyl-tripeptide--D-alanyl-D-alanine ligase
VLGPLAELGEAGTEVYREIGALAVLLGVDRLVVVGEQARPICWAAQDGTATEHRAPEADTLGTRGRRAGRAAPVLVTDVPAVLELLRGELTPGDVVLVKASRVVGLERVAEGLLAAPTAGGGR